MNVPRLIRMLPVALGAVAALTLVAWLAPHPERELAMRVPGSDRPTNAAPVQYTGNPVLKGELIPGPGKPADLPGDWPRFRGPHGTGIITQAVTLARQWAPGHPRKLWTLEVGEGYAGPIVRQGRVYLMDYDQKAQADALRCLSLADGQEIWRFTYPVKVKRNHGMSRTVPTLTDDAIVAMGPLCHVVCLDIPSGKLRWGLDLVHDYGTTVPPWYAGQCPLVDQGRLILAPGGPDALLAAIDLKDGKEIWRTPNPNGWKMTHSSVVPMEFGGKRFYVYCASRGVVGVDATDGRILWETDEWRISIATVPSPVILEGGRIFLSGGYNAGCMMLQLEVKDGALVPKVLYRLPAEEFGATQHTPIYYGGHIYGVRPDGLFACLSPEGKIIWTSDPDTNFGLGGYIIANGLIYVMDDHGVLSLLEATPEKYHLLAQAKVLPGRESWGPLCLAANRLIARDLTQMVCLDVGSGP